VTLEEEEVARIKRHLPVIERRGRPSIGLPCAAHSGTACTIYDARPANCAAYRCDLLRAFDGGALSLSVALEKIARLRELVSKLQGALSAQDRGLALFEAAQAFFDAHTAASARREHADVLLDMAEFLHICRRDFGVSGKPSGHVD
jgi:hypothetical protein